MLWENNKATYGEDQLLGSRSSGGGGGGGSYGIGNTV